MDLGGSHRDYWRDYWRDCWKKDRMKEDDSRIPARILPNDSEFIKLPRGFGHIRGTPGSIVATSPQ